MRLGVCSTDFERMGIEALFQKIAELGFASVQLSFDSFLESGFEADGALEIPPSIPEAALRAVQRACAQFRLPVVALNGTFNMAHPDSSVRAEGLRRFEAFARAAAALPCRDLSICTGTRERSHLWTFHPANESPAAWADMEDTVLKACAIARGHGLRLLLEVEASNVVNTPEKALRLIRRAGADALQVVMDCANLFHPGEASAEQARTVIGHAFDLLGEHVALAHGKDILASDGIQFCPTGEGIVDYEYFMERLRACGYRGDMMLHGIYGQQAMARAVTRMRPLVDAWNAAETQS